ncbi:hypothetical protein [Streptomyces sp. NRRL F-2664]|uniref:hypothetical protein n=1 Tax=Streptomyces sp. NRRL F-2664 TaxID=1463842 RepID=UPI000691C453|nr:hypothetical protein [Streptomyces sp. NRRL F-2664]
MVSGRRIRFTAVLVVVVFALTGFSSHGGGSGGKSKSGKSKGSGGGCSSSKSKKKSGGGNGSTASAAPTGSASPSGDPATVVVLTCTRSGAPVTTLRFTSRLDRRATVEVDLRREGAGGAAVESEVVRVELGARETRTVDVPLDEPARAAEVKNCRLGQPTTRGSAPAATRTPGAGSGSAPGSASGGSTRTGEAEAVPRPKTSRKPR